MPQELLAPLQEVIRRAAESKVEGPATKLRARFESASNEIVLLADCSGSMNDLIGSLGMTKAEHLQIALKDVLALYPKIRLIAFHSYAKEIATAAELPKPTGGTNLARALEMAGRHKPRKTIVISDGLPDNQETALKAAEAITGAIDTIYCGPDQHPAVEFLNRLSRQTGGKQVTWDGYRGEISTAIRGLLAAPVL